jgi:hypothetical protein
MMVLGRVEAMTELRKIGENQYKVLMGERVIGLVWNWHGSWSAEAGGKTHHGLKSRKEAIARVEDVHGPKR